MRIEDGLLSKVQCTLFYSRLSGWMIEDGKTESGSTNGSWVYLNEEFEVYDGMVLKIRQTVLTANLV